jgi:fatty-acyl-CoA synthase
MLSAAGTTLIPTRLGMRNRAFIASIWRQVERYGITVIGGVPTSIASLNAVPVGADIRSMRIMSTGGSPLPTELADAFERATGKPIRNILGMTECAGVVTIEPFHGPRTPGSTGFRLPFTQVGAFREVDGIPNLSSQCDADETGVLALRGPNVSPGYSSAEFNAGTFAPDGWLISGDLGHVDAAGRVYVTGRAKDVIIRGGHNIDPATIEDALLQHADVSIAAAVGQPDAYAGELPVAFVVLKPGAVADAETLRAFSAGRVAEPAAAPKHVFIMSELPLTPIGKVYKPALRTVAAGHALCEQLTRAGIGPETYSLAAESVPTIDVFAAADESRVRAALAGVPVRFEVCLREK